MSKTTLYGKSKNGKIKEWSISVNKISDEHSQIIIEHGYQDGKKQTDIKDLTKGKNIGKKNETTPYEQALFEAKSLVIKKMDSNYATAPEYIPNNWDGLFLPMLAHSYDKHSKKIKYPCWVQPKLDGARLLVKKEGGEIKMWSRKGKEVLTLSKIKKDLDSILKDGDCLDGEVYVHGWDFQRIISAIKKEKDDTNLLQYHIYDCPNRFDTFEDRFINVKFKLKNTSHLRLVRTEKVENYIELCKHEMRYITLGYEGLMVRNKLSLYKYKDRSYDLQKVKRFEDEEFRIIGGKDGVGREEGSVIFRCVNEDGLPFDVRPKGTREERIEWFKDLDNLIGENLTVKFQGRTSDNIPRFPVGLRIRPSFDK